MDAKYILVAAALLGATAGFVWSAMPPAAASGSGPPAQLAAEIEPAVPRMSAEEVEQSIYYAGCDEVRAAGKAPLYASQPGYSERMDGDGDGVACEPHPDR